MSSDPFGQSAERQYTVRPYNQRMARRVARRAHVDGEGAVAVAFTFNNLATMVTLGVIVDIVKFVPIIGSYVDLALSILGFYFHRIVLVTDQNVYVFRDWPFHFPGKLLMTHQRAPGVVQLGAPDQLVVHAIHPAGPADLPRRNDRVPRLYLYPPGAVHRTGNQPARRPVAPDRPYVAASQPHAGLCCRRSDRWRVELQRPRGEAIAKRWLGDHGGIRLDDMVPDDNDLVHPICIATVPLTASAAPSGLRQPRRKCCRGDVEVVLRSTFGVRSG